MMGFSLGKILLLVALVAAVWFGFRYLADYQKRLQARAAAKAANPPPPMAAEDTVRCRVCGTYVLGPRPTACARGDCPFRT